eukprot:superscaffoldBa00000770_g7120
MHSPQFGRTEVIDNTLNPDFVRKFVLDFFFEEKQNLRFDVPTPHPPILLIFYRGPMESVITSRISIWYGGCNASDWKSLQREDFLGQMFCTLGEIIGSTGSRLERTLSSRDILES